MRPFSIASFAYLSVALCSFSLAQTISPTPADGDTKITLLTAPAAKGDTIAIFAAPAPVAPALPVCNASGTAVPLAPNTSNSVLSGSQTTLLLQNPLAQGQVICAVITSSAVPAAAGSPRTTPQVVVNAPVSPPGFDWGMVRAYFTFGGLTSQADSEFSHEDLFLAFRIDKQYVRFHKNSNPDNYGHRIGLMSFFETRLTALPVAVQSCTPTATTTCANSSSSSTSATAVAATTSQAFLNSQKSARLDFGIYAPVLLHEWHVSSRVGTQTQSAPYALFVAPLIKIGFDTSLNGLNQTQQGSSTPSAVQSIGNSSEFYKFYDYGFRLGHYQLAGDPEISPTLLSYLDVTWGRFSNLASLICDTTKDTYDPGANTCSLPVGSTATSIGELPWQRDTRLNVEGLLEIPATNGFSIGFSTNVVFDPLGHQGTSTLKHIRPNDDLRFLFAYKFDISKLAAKLAPQPTN